MKNNNKFLSPMVCVFLLSSSVVYSAEECRGVRGRISTNSINQVQQLGVVSIRLDGIRKAEKCGLLGTITGFDPELGVPTELGHLISCKDHSTLTTVDDVEVTSIVPCSDTGAILHVNEESTITGGTGKFENAVGWLTITGTVDSCTGMNSLIYEGEICKPEDTEE